MATYTTKAGVRYGSNNNFTPNIDNIACGFNTSEELKTACSTDPTCVAYIDHSLPQNRCTKHSITTTNSPEVADAGYTAYLKQYSNCKTIEGNSGSMYADGFCVEDTSIENSEARGKLLKYLESINPKTLTICKGPSNQILYVHYSPNPPSASTAFLPYQSTQYKKESLYIYFIISIDLEDVYRFELYGRTNTIYSTVYINGVPLDTKPMSGTASTYKSVEASARLTPGDYFVCIEMATGVIGENSDLGGVGLQPMSKIAVRNINSYSAIDSYIKKYVNFYTQVSDKYNNALSNVCTVDNYTSSEYCKDLIKNTSTINDLVLSKCLTNVNGNLLYTGIDVCTAVVDSVMAKSADVNSSLSTSIYKAVETWFTNKTSLSENLSAMTTEELAKINVMFDKIKLYSGTIPGIEKASTRTQLVAYCEKTAGDVFNISNNNTLCGKLYNDTSLVNYNNPALTNNTDSAAEIGASKDKLKLSYCNKSQANGTYRFQTDVKCQEEIKNSNLLNTDVMNRCTYAGSPPFQEKYCYDLLKQNIESELDPSKQPVTNTQLRLKLKNAANDYAINETNKISKSSNPTGKLISEDYIVNYYSKLPDRKEGDLLNSNYTDYCISTDPTLSSTSCGPLYKTFNTNNSVVRSRAHMRNKNCMSDSNLMTDADNQESKDSNTDKCRTMATNGNIHNLYTFVDKVNTYCANPENIAKDECKDYYTNATGRYIKSLSNPTAKSAFSDSVKTGAGAEVEGFENGVSNINVKMIFFFILIIMCVVVAVQTFRKKSMPAKAAVIRQNT